MRINLTEVDFKTGEEIGVTPIEMDITEDEWKEYSKLFCECNYLEEHPNLHPKYVTNYKGVSHGWICPKCKKITQIG